MDGFVAVEEEYSDLMPHKQHSLDEQKVSSIDITDLYENKEEELHHLQHSEDEDEYEDSADDTSTIQTEDDAHSDVPSEQSMFGGKIERPQLPHNSDYPRYINKCFWTRSDDENLEKLIDRGVLKVLNSRRVRHLWQDPKNVELLYDDKTFRKFVEKVYDGIDGWGWINETLGRLYEHQLKQAQSQPKKKKKLSTDKQIFHQMQNTEFSDFDSDKDGKIDLKEFVAYFKARKIKIGKDKLQIMFNGIQRNLDREIDGGIDRIDFNHWKESLEQNSLVTQSRLLNFNLKEQHKGIWKVYYNTRSNTYHFAEGMGNIKMVTQWTHKPRMITRLHYNAHLYADSNFKWAVFIKDVKNRLGEDFKKYHSELRKPKGYWHIYEDHNTAFATVQRMPKRKRLPSISLQQAPIVSNLAPEDSVTNEAIPKRDLDLIFLLLQHYYLGQLHDANTPSAENFDDPMKRHLEEHKEVYGEDSYNSAQAGNQTMRDQLQKVSWLLQGKNVKGLQRMEEENKIIFEIERNAYVLTYWNKRGKYQTTALGLAKINSKSKSMRRKGKDMRNKERCYLRFNTDFEVDNIEWQVPDFEDVKDTRVAQQLEASFLGNDERNFNPQQFKVLNNVLLSELKREGAEKNESQIYYDGYILSVTFTSTKDDATDAKISGMSQIAFNRSGHVTRKVIRMKDGADSLNKHFENSNSHLNKWKEARKLSTREQQKYMFCFIVAIAAKIKYIDIEFAAQAVLLPGSSASYDEDTQIESFMDIDARDVKKEQRGFEFFEGYLIPLEQVWCKQADGKAKVLTKHKSAELIKGKREYRWMQLEETANAVFSKEQAQLLRLAECIRKYVLEVEQGDTLNTLWPWYRNSFHARDDVVDASKYDDLIKKEFFLQSWKLVTSKEGSSILEIFANHQYGDHEEEDDDNTNENKEPRPIRHKRKFGAYALLDSSDVLRNLNILKNQLSPLLQCIEEKATKHHQDMSKYPEQFQEKIDEYVRDNICGEAKDANTKRFWQENIQMINESFLNKKKAFEMCDEGFNLKEAHQLFNYHFENIKYLDIDRFKLPIFEEFVKFFFVASDENRYKRIHQSNNKHYVGADKEYYRAFLESWRWTPQWYTYQHDILLLELVLRNGVHPCKIMADLEGRKHVLYKIRLRCEDFFVSRHRCANAYDRYYQFKMWCKVHYNLLHRLKYITNIIIKNLLNRGGKISLYHVRMMDNPDDIPTFSCKSRIFSDYQRTTHIQFVTSQEKERLPTYETRIVRDISVTLNKTNTMDSINNEYKACCIGCCCCKHAANYENLTSYDEDALIDPEGEELVRITSNHSHRNMKNTTQCRIRCNDPFLNRDLDIELMETLQSFDLLKYGVPLALFIIEQLKKQMIPTYWKILGALMNILPSQLAISALKNKKSLEILRHGQPDQLKMLCLQLVAGATFKPSAALAAAKLFDELAEEDLIQEAFWTECGNVFESRAFEEINRIESNHLLYVCLNIPLFDNNRQSLVELALDGKRIEFLNNDRINSVIHHLYVHGYLKPGEDIEAVDMEYRAMLNQLWNYPFDFYLSARGYHWTTTVLFMLYFGLVCWYAYLRPMQEGDVTGVNHILGYVFWICNLGYVLYEVFELWEKGAKAYFNVGVKGQTNLLDVVLSVLWLFLLGLRYYFVFWYDGYDRFDALHPTSLQELYIFIFALQICLLTLRSLTLFSNTKYLGVLLKVIKLMTVQIFKFLYIYVVSMCGILFGLWFIVVANACNTTGGANDACDNFAISELWFGLQYVFEVFIGTGDLSGVSNQPLGIIFMVAVTFFGTLILTNLLIALMTTEYEAVQSQAKAEVIFNETELTIDLTSRSRQMPPPLNIVVIVISLIIHILNFFTALLHPRYLNIYYYIDFSTFEKFRRFKLWPCCTVDWKKKGKVELDKEGQDKLKSSFKYTRKSVLKFYIGSNLIKLKRKLCPTPSSIKQKLKQKRKIKRHKTTFKQTHDLAKENWAILHKGCYGHILPEDEQLAQDKSKKRRQVSFVSTAKMETDLTAADEVKHTNAANLKAITMSQLMTQFEANGSRFDAADSALLKQLTSTETLFCEFCNRPILASPDYLVSELTTPYAALLDLLSALTFLFIPIAWIALLCILALMSMFDGISDVFVNDHPTTKYKSKDFDREYFPNQFTQ
eukprot:384693_1